MSILDEITAGLGKQVETISQIYGGADDASIAVGSVFLFKTSLT
jgi:hypothetical protein